MSSFFWLCSVSHMQITLLFLSDVSLCVSWLFSTCLYNIIRNSRRALLLRAISDPNTLPHYISMSKRNLKRQRESADSAGGKQPRLTGVSARETGWLLREVTELRRAALGQEFNNKRLRYLSETQNIKPSSDGVLYWMSRDQRVQGKVIAGTYFMWGVLVGGAWYWGGATLGDFRQNPNSKQPKFL